MEAANGFVYGTLAMVLYVSRLLGLAPVTFNRSHNGWRITLSRAWNIYGCIFTTIISICTTATIIIKSSATDKTTDFINRYLGNVMIPLLCVFAITAASYRGPDQMKSVIYCLNRVQSINNELSMNWPKDLKKSRIVLLVLWLLLMLFLYSSNEFMDLYYNASEDSSAPTISVNTMHLFISLCYFIEKLLLMRFMLMVLQVLQVFETINDNLRRLYKDGIQISSEVYLKSIHQLRLAHMSICEVVHVLNSFNGLTLLILLLSFVINLVMSSLYLIKKIVNENETLLTTAGMTQIIWWLDCFIDLMLLIEPCHLTDVEMDVTRDLVARMMHLKYATPTEQLELFFRYLTLKKVSYSPLMVTTFSRSLVLSIFTTLITYIVILIEI